MQEQCFVVDNKWSTPATAYPNMQVGSARIRKYRCARGYYSMSGVNGYIFFKVPKALSMTELQIKNGRGWKTWMVDNPPQWQSMQAFGEAAHGCVLIGGLGLGLLLHVLRDNPAVEHITVCETNEDVIQLVAPHFMDDPERILIVNRDFHYQAVYGDAYYHTIIGDIWTSSSKEEKAALIPEVMRLNFQVRQHRPGAQVDFHGFVTISDTQVVPQETQDFIINIGGI